MGGKETGQNSHKNPYYQLSIFLRTNNKTTRRIREVGRIIGVSETSLSEQTSPATVSVAVNSVTGRRCKIPIYNPKGV